MWRNDTQKARAITLLLKRTGLPALQGLFGSVAGPSNRAWELYDAKGGPLSSGERKLLFAAFAFWNGSEALTFADVLDLDLERAALICELAVAVQTGHAAVEEWIRSHQDDAKRERARSVG